MSKSIVSKRSLEKEQRLLKLAETQHSPDVANSGDDCVKIRRSIDSEVDLDLKQISIKKVLNKDKDVDKVKRINMGELDSQLEDIIMSDEADDICKFLC